MLKIYIYWHKCSCHGCDGRTGGNVKIELESAGFAIFQLIFLKTQQKAGRGWRMARGWPNGMTS